MGTVKNYNTFCILGVVSIFLFGACSDSETDLYQNDPKFLYGTEHLIHTVQKYGLEMDSTLVDYEIDVNLDREESYAISIRENGITIRGADAAGLMYGCLDLADMISRAKNIPENLYVHESPAMRWRGVCILLMKLGTYNYPVTPQDFPFFYDKKLWIDYLDFLAANKFNYIALWNGHPFAYFVKMEKYPEAQDGMPDELIDRNNKMLHWLVTECSRRNIKPIFEFYNIHTSVYFQQAHDLPDEISEPSPLLAEYTSYCIQQFVREFPDVGLYITAGEALNRKYAAQWVNSVILDAVRRGEKKPLIFLRSWFLDYDQAQQIFDYFPDIWIERKYNVEMIADTLIDPENEMWAELAGGNHIVNIHMAANLEPFRWNPPQYIQKCIQSSVSAGAHGLHLYPRKAWRWPYSADIGQNITQWERDKYWFQMWARYAWNPHRDRRSESEYWLDYFYREYGTNETAQLLLQAFESNADVLPGIQRLFWAGYDNHTVVTSGLMLNQIERLKGIPFLSLKPLVRIPEYLEMISKNRQINGLSPVELLERKVDEAIRARENLESARKHATRNMDKLDRYFADAKAIELTARFYKEKLKAAEAKVRMAADPDTNIYAHQFLSHLKRSVDHFHELTDLTKNYYESISDVSAVHPVPLKVLPYHWSDILPYFEKEYEVYADEIFQRNSHFANKPVHNGCVGVCFGSPDLVNPKRIIYTDKLEFDWETNPPEEGRNWSVLLTGFIQSPITGEVKFYVSSLQNVKLYIGDRILIDKTSEKKESIVNLSMQKNRWYTVRVEYDNVDFTGSNLEIFWSWGDNEKKSIRKENLKHSSYQLKKANRSLVLGF